MTNPRYGLAGLALALVLAACQSAAPIGSAGRVGGPDPDGGSSNTIDEPGFEEPGFEELPDGLDEFAWQIEPRYLVEATEHNPPDGYTGWEFEIAARNDNPDFANPDSIVLTALANAGGYAYGVDGEIEPVELVVPLDFGSDYPLIPPGMSVPVKGVVDVPSDVGSFTIKVSSVPNDVSSCPFGSDCPVAPEPTELASFENADFATSRTPFRYTVDGWPSLPDTYVAGPVTYTIGDPYLRLSCQMLGQGYWQLVLPLKISSTHPYGVHAGGDLRTAYGPGDSVSIGYPTGETVPPRAELDSDLVADVTPLQNDCHTDPMPTDPFAVVMQLYQPNDEAQGDYFGEQLLDTFSIGVVPRGPDET